LATQNKKAGHMTTGLNPQGFSNPEGFMQTKPKQKSRLLCCNRLYIEV
jgi:hypothetical protein